MPRIRVNTLNTSKKTILISAPTGRSNKYFLDTYLYSLLKSHYQIGVFSPFYSLPIFREKYYDENVLFFDHPGTQIGHVFSIIQKVYMRYRLLHSDFRLADRPIGRLNLSMRRNVFKSTYYQCEILYRAEQLLSEWNRVNQLSKVIFKSSYYEGIFHKLQPSLAISTSPCKSIQDYCFQYAAESMRIPLVFFPGSWDDFTRSGEFPFNPTKIFSWGAEMSRHARDYFDFTDKQTVDVGIIRFESSEGIAMSPIEFRARMRIPKEYKIILFPSNQHYLVTPEPRILEELVYDIELGKFGKSILILRPNNTWGEFQKKYITKYANHPCVRLNIPEEDGVSKYEGVDISWMDVLSNVDLVITICSMVVLEAFHFDKPVINLNYDYGMMSIYGFSYKVYYNREVYELIQKTGSTIFANSRDELNESIRNYLENPSLHRYERKMVMANWDVPQNGTTSRCERAFQELQILLS